MFSPFRVVILFLLVCFGSLLTIPHLRIDLVPHEKTAFLDITYSLPNSSPDVVEQQATSVLENAFSQLTHLKKIQSHSYYNRGHIRLEFDKRTDISIKRLEATAIVRRVYSQLPKTMSYPQILQSQDNKKEVDPIIIYTVTGIGSSYEIKKKAESIYRKHVTRIDGVRDVQFKGSESMEVTIVFDQHLVDLYRIDVAQIPALIIRQSNDHFPGSVTINQREHFIKIKSLEQSIKSIGDITIPCCKVDAESEQLSEDPIYKQQGEYNYKGTRLRDVAQIYLQEQEPMGHFRINSKNAIRFAVYGRLGGNSISIANQIKQTVQKYSIELPDGYEVILEYDQTEFLDKELNKNYVRATLSLLLLITLLFVSYRNWRYVVVLAGSLIVNMSLTVMFAWLFDVSVHFYSIAGFSISLSLMIGNAIVVTDYCYRSRSKIFSFTLIAATFTSIITLSLIFFIEEEDIKNLVDFASVIVLSLVSSLITSLIFTPRLCVLIFNEKSRPQFFTAPFRRIFKIVSAYQSIIHFFVRFRRTFICFIIFSFGTPIFLLPPTLGNQGWYNSTVGSDLYQRTIRQYTDVLLGGALRPFVKNVFAGNTYRDVTRTRLYVTAELPFGNTLKQMDFMIGKMEEYIGSFKCVDKYISTISSGQVGTIEIVFKENAERTLAPSAVKQDLISRSLDWGGVNWTISGLGRGFSNAAEEPIPKFKAVLKGYNYDELDRQVQKFATKLLKHKRIQEVNVNRSLDGEKPAQEYVVTLDHQRLAKLGIGQSEIIKYLFLASKTTRPNAYVTIDNTIFPLRLGEKNSESFSAWDMMESPIQLENKKSIRLKDVAKLSLHQTTGSIHREDRQYIRMVTFDYHGSARFGEIFLDEKIEELRREIPVGYSVVKQSWNNDDSDMKQWYILIFFALIANFLVCGILFESLKVPIFIIVTVPTSFIGIFLMFSIFDFPFDQGGYASFILLSGLVVNAAIFVLNDFKPYLQKDRKYNRILLKKIANRSRTILLTFISVSVGLIPFLIEGLDEVFWFSLAIGTIGGLCLAIFSIFLLLPVLVYKK